MSLHKTAVISDTHGILRPEVIQMLQTAELILHAGDIADQEILDELRKIGRVTAVRGNCDRNWAKDLPREALFDLYGRKVYMVHDADLMSAKASEADLIIYGHSHQYEEKEAGGRLWLNPGSCGPRRFGRELTMAMLEFETETGELKIRKINLSAEGAGSTEPESSRPKLQSTRSGGCPPELESGKLQRAVVLVVGDLKKGKSVDGIVRSRKISRELTEQICQIYFTHPGIDIQGILNRIEIAGR